MSHPQQFAFFEECSKRFKQQFQEAVRVVEVGSLDINGSVRNFFPNAIEYLGVDLGEGSCVDLVVPGEMLEMPNGWADIAISTECFEHCKSWNDVLINLTRMLKVNGIFLMTCATFGRAVHGTSDSDKDSSPYTNDYYKNIGVVEFSTQDCVSHYYEKHGFEVDAISGDLYFWGIRNNREFVDLFR